MPHSAYAHERVHVWNLRMSEALHYIWHVICKCILLVFDNWVWRRCHIWRFVDKSNFQVNAQLIIMNHLYFLCVYLYWVLQRRYILEFVDESNFELNAQLIIMNYLYFSLCLFVYELFRNVAHQRMIKYLFEIKNLNNTKQNFLVYIVIKWWT